MDSLTTAVQELAEARGETEEDALRWVIGAAESAARQARQAQNVKPHRVAHDLISEEELVETWEGGHKDNTREPNGDRPGLRKVVTTHNQRDDCPDCGRALVSANDPDLPRGVTHVLVCTRLHGMKLTGDLTDHDIVACGLES